jgi:phosphoglycolate phosphatase-like HAD superfamily hydrolase
MTAVSERLAAANPDYTIASVADLPAVLDAIKQRLSRSGPS